MSRKALVVTGVLIVAAAATVGVGLHQGRQWVDRDRLSFARRVTGLALADPDALETIGNLETQVGFCMRLGPLARGEIESVGEPLNADADASADFFGQLPCPSPLPREARRLLVQRGCTEVHSWLLLLDVASGETWLEVLFPDSSGDPPPCH